MTYHEFVKAFDPTAPKPIYLLGPHKAPRARAASFEPILADRAAKLITDALVEPSLRDMAYGAFYADESDPAAIAADAQTMPFLAERRVILLRGADRFASETAGKPLLRYLEDPSPSTVIILIAERIDKRSKMYKAAEKHGEIVACGELDARALEDWLNAEAAASSKTIDRDAVREILVRAGGGLSEVQNAFTLASGFSGGEERITQKHVIAACADVAEDQVWALTDAIASSNTREAMRVLRSFYDLGKSEFELMGTINWLLKTAYAVASAEPNDPFLRSFPAKKCQPLVEKLGMVKIQAAFHLIVEADFMLRSTGVDRRLALELLVIKLAAPRPRRAA